MKEMLQAVFKVQGAWHSPKIGYKRCLLLFIEIIVSFTL
jgi:hypothetical protein